MRTREDFLRLLNNEEVLRDLAQTAAPIDSRGRDRDPGLITELMNVAETKRRRRAEKRLKEWNKHKSPEVARE